MSLTQEGTDSTELIPVKWREKIFVIDAFSRETQARQNFIPINNPADLTNIQIAIEKAEKSLVGKKIIIFDSINALSIY